jgi:transcriptional regulator with XRE-family HTH domain
MTVRKPPRTGVRGGSSAESECGDRGEPQLTRADHRPRRRIRRSLGYMSVEIGDRLKSVRKRRGLTQQELADQSGVSISLIRKIEQGEKSDVRLETLRKLAVGLRVRTSDLQTRRDAEYADAATDDLWEPVRRALVGQFEQLADEPVTLDGVRAAFEELRPLMGTHQYRTIASSLPALLRDADQLDEQDGRIIRARILGMAGWLLVQNRQFDTAEDTLARAIDSAGDHLDAAAAANTLVWAYLRQGRLTDAERLAIEWADRIEPRFSRATTHELALWGRLWLYAANASIRDNQPGRAEDAMSLARSAAYRIGREVLSDHQTVRTYGPVTVGHIAAETAIIAEQPDRALAIAERTPPTTLQPVSAGRLRHRLDVACAHAQMRNHSTAVERLAELRQSAPEWLAQQRYARDILGAIIYDRRTLTDEMRDLADFVRLDY